jgi:hypothetical protein
VASPHLRTVPDQESAGRGGFTATEFLTGRKVSFQASFVGNSLGMRKQKSLNGTFDLSNLDSRRLYMLLVVHTVGTSLRGMFTKPPCRKQGEVRNDTQAQPTKTNFNDISLFSYDTNAIT